MIFDSQHPSRETFERESGWSLRPEGACQGERCVPLDRPAGDRVDVADIARQLGMPVVRDERHGLWSLGPQAGGRSLASARMPRLVLPDVAGRPFDLETLRGTKILLLAWASW